MQCCPSTATPILVLKMNDRHGREFNGNEAYSRRVASSDRYELRLRVQWILHRRRRRWATNRILSSIALCSVEHECPYPSCSMTGWIRATVGRTHRPCSRLREDLAADWARTTTAKDSRWSETRRGVDEVENRSTTSTKAMIHREVSKRRVADWWECHRRSKRPTLFSVDVPDWVKFVRR